MNAASSTSRMLGSIPSQRRATSFTGAMLRARYPFSKTFAISDTLGDETRITLRMLQEQNVIAASRHGAVTPPTSLLISFSLPWYASQSLRQPIPAKSPDSKQQADVTAAHDAHHRGVGENLRFGGARSPVHFSLLRSRLLPCLHFHG